MLSINQAINAIFGIYLPKNPRICQIRLSFGREVLQTKLQAEVI